MQLIEAHKIQVNKDLEDEVYSEDDARIDGAHNVKANDESSEQEEYERLM
jgi:hypothetical protein